jgi:acyl carrier protein
VDTTREVLSVLEEALHLKGRTATFSGDTPLLGAVPELDSMAVVGLISALEERFGFLIDDEEISGAIFGTVGSLTAFVDGKLAG